jgi:hypothetical protein
MNFAPAAAANATSIATAHWCEEPGPRCSFSYQHYFVTFGNKHHMRRYLYSSSGRNLHTVRQPFAATER